MRIRRARAADARAFAALARSEIEAGLPHGWTASRIARLLARPDTNAYALADTRGPGIGGFSVARLGFEHGHLMLHAIAPGLRRRGFGRALLDWQIRAAVTAGIARLTLEVRLDNAEARRFYAARGFGEDRRLPLYYSGLEDGVRLRLEPLVGDAAPPSPPPFSTPRNRNGRDD